jgi:hypothetical protein
MENEISGKKYITVNIPNKTHDMLKQLSGDIPIARYIQRLIEREYTNVNKQESR